jgi:hypothetical protein
MVIKSSVFLHSSILHQGQPLQYRLQIRKRIKSKEKKEGKARLIIFVGEEYIRLKEGTLLSAGVVPHFSVTGGSLGGRR